MTYDINGVFVVHKEIGSKQMFIHSMKWLYYSDMTHNIRAILFNIVYSIKSKYSITFSIGQPSAEDFIKYIEGNMIPNFDITRQDILQAEDLYRPNISSLKGKTTRCPTDHVCLRWAGKI